MSPTHLFQLLQRPLAAANYIPQLDGVRFYALIGVLAFHCSGYLLANSPLEVANNLDGSPLVTAIHYGHYGVQLFFVISGFILALPFLRWHCLGEKEVRLSAYFARRLTRLEPPYLINLALLAAAHAILLHQPVSELVPHLAASAFYCHNLLFGQASTINFVAWSLEIEVQFYLLTPVLMQVARWRSLSGRFLLYSAGFLVPLLVRHSLTHDAAITRLLDLSIAGHLQYFVAGIAACDLYVNKQRWRRRESLGDALGIAAAIATALSLNAPTAGIYLLPLAFAALLWSALTGKIHSRISSGPMLTAIGGMCYSIYLYHPSLKSLAGRAVTNCPSLGIAPLMVHLLQLFALMAAIIVCCVPFYLAFERPFMVRRTLAGQRT